MGMNEEYGYNIQTTNTPTNMQTEIKIQNDYIECLKTHGFLKGSVLGLKRILSCHPIKILGGGSGLDTVPVNKETIKENK